MRSFVAYPRRTTSGSSAGNDREANFHGQPTGSSASKRRRHIHLYGDCKNATRVMAATTCAWVRNSWFRSDPSVWAFGERSAIRVSAGSGGRADPRRRSPVQDPFVTLRRSHTEKLPEVPDPTGPRTGNHSEDVGSMPPVQPKSDPHQLPSAGFDCSVVLQKLRPWTYDRSIDCTSK